MKDRLLTVAGVALFVGVVLGGVITGGITANVYRAVMDRENAAHALDLASKDAEIAALEERLVYASDAWTIRGNASWYEDGEVTSTGAKYDPNEITVAHKGFPIGMEWKITNPRNGKSVIVPIVDRGPYFGDRVWDLSRAAFAMIEDLSRGVIPVIATPAMPERRGR